MKLRWNNSQKKKEKLYKLFEENAKLKSSAGTEHSNIWLKKKDLLFE